MKFNIYQLNWFTFSAICLLVIAAAATAEQEANAQDVVAAIAAEADREVADGR